LQENAMTDLLTIKYAGENGSVIIQKFPSKEARDGFVASHPHLLMDVIISGPAIDIPGELQEYVDPDSQTYRIFNQENGGGIISAGSQYECGFVINGNNGAGQTYPQVYFDSWDQAGTYDADTKTWTHNGTKSRMLVQLFPDGLKQSTDGVNWTSFALEP
jgi:hypothetical protein